METTKLNINPVVKWAGGKRQLLPNIITHIPKKINTYIEPFIGGGAVLFETQPKKAIINDLNFELMNMYYVVANYTDELIEALNKMKANHSEEYFYEVRAYDRLEEQVLDNIEMAARLIYLNKTCFNGLYRVNKKNQFNAPYGHYKNPSIFDEQNIRNMAEYLKNSDISYYSRDYKDILKLAEPGDFVYLDPPYDGTWTNYTDEGFNKTHQEELAEACIQLHADGIRFLLSNSRTDFIEYLYKGFNMEVVLANRAINSDKNGRGKVEELLIYNEI